jgi:excinuclease ABC, B subunit
VAELRALPKQEASRLLGSLEDEMIQASADTDFERAASLRDQIVALRSRLEGASAADVIARLKVTDRRGSAHATRRRYRKRKH